MKHEKLGTIDFEILTPQEVATRLGENSIVLIDVRTPFEYGFEHIAEALLFPLSSFDPKKLPSQIGKPIVFHCGSGMRSHKIANICATAGISPLAHMEGGLAGWKEAKLPFRTIDPATGAYVVK